MPARFEDVSDTRNHRGVPMDLGGRYAQPTPSSDIVITGFSGR